MFKSLPIHMLWVEGELSRLARLGLTSFLRHGYTVHLWTYDGQALNSAGATLQDASSIMPRPQGTLAGFTDMFRYRLLSLHGGVWADVDVVALTGDPDLPAAPAISTERRRPLRHRFTSATADSTTQVNNCFIVSPIPRSDGLMALAWQSASALPQKDITWDSVGPHLINKLLLDHRDHGFAFLPTKTVNPVAWWNVPMAFLEDRAPPPSPFLHLYSSIWRQRGVDANEAFPAGSLASRLWQENGL
jgi:hypothetical protein